MNSISGPASRHSPLFGAVAIPIAVVAIAWLAASLSGSPTTRIDTFVQTGATSVPAADTAQSQGTAAQSGRTRANYLRSVGGALVAF
jgi:hypothetical protein